LKTHAERLFCQEATCTKQDEERCCRVTRAEEAGEETADASTAEEKAADARRRAEEAAEAAAEAARKKAVAWYGHVGCFPTPTKLCSGQMCVFDRTCEATPPRLGGIGCYAAGLDMRCRFCGFGAYPDCPETPSCAGDACKLSDESLAWCGKVYNITCPRTGRSSGSANVAVFKRKYAERAGRLFGFGGGGATAVAALGVALAAGLLVWSRHQAAGRVIRSFSVVGSEDDHGVALRSAAEVAAVAEPNAFLE